MDAIVSVSLLIEKLEDFLRGQAAASNPLFKKQVQTTINDLNSFKQFLKDAEDREASSGCWSMNDQTVARVLKAIYSADDATDTLQQIRRRENQTSPFMFSFSSLCSHILFIHEMKKFMNEVRRLEKKKEKAATRDNATTSRLLSFENDQEYGWRWLFLEETDYFVGPEQKMNELFIRLTLHDFPKFIAVVGEGGLGKTTMVTTLYNRVDVRRNFTNRAWVQVPSLSDARYVLADILRQINQVELVVEPTLSEDELMVRIGELLNGGRCLIVLEGVGVGVECSKILAPLLNSSQFDARIIITTRTVLNLPHQATYLTLRLGRLNEEQSWKLFLNKVRMAEADYMMNDSQLITFKKQILKICGGLPSAIVLLAGLLSTKRQHYDDWYRVIVRASNNKGDILALSYHDLPSEIKPCFLYMGIFPRKSEIPVRRLIHLWVAEGFVMPSDSEKTNHEDIAERYFKELVFRNMIQVRRKSDGRPKTCYMLGVLYDFFSSKAEAVGFFNRQFHTSCASTTKQSELAAVRRLATHSGMINNFPSAFLQNLRSFVAFNSHIHARDVVTDVGKFLNKVISNRGFGLLYMLDLEGLYKPTLSDDVLQKLIHLKYLGLRSTLIDSLPDAVRSLPCLETLDVKHTSISNVIHIDKAEKLRHLYLSLNSSDKGQLDLMSSLTNLRTLCGVKIESPSELTNLQRLTRLRKLKLTGPGNVIGSKEIAECVSKLTNLQYLKLRSKDSSYISLDLSLKEHESLQDLYLLGLLSQERFHNLFPPYLRKLTLLSSRINANDQLLALGQLPHLNILRLFCDSYFGKQLIFPSKAFTNLLILKLRSLPNLEEWIVEEGAMKYLNGLEIRDCKHLKPPQGLVNLKFLKQLAITKMTMGFEEAVEDILRGRKEVYQSSIEVGPWGGRGGSSWSYKPNGGIVEIIINHGVWIDSLSFKSVCANKEAEASSNFGGEGGSKTQISIDWPEEYLTSISGTTVKYYDDSLVGSLTFYTNWCTHGPFGSEEGTHFSLPVENRVIVGFHGRSGIYVDAIGVYQEAATSIQGQVYQSSIEVGPWGGSGGSSWSYKPNGGIVEIIISHGVVIDSLSFKSVCANKEAESSSNFGGKGGSKTQISIDWPKEYLTSISGTTVKYNNDNSLVQSLTFYTNWRTYGPFGSEEGTPFSLPVANRVIVGFHGRAGLYLDAIGVYQKAATSIQGQFMTPKVYQSSIEVGPWGGLGGTRWSYMPKGGIVEKIINHGEIIDSLSLKSVSANNVAESSSNFGGKGGNKTQVCQSPIVVGPWGGLGGSRWSYMPKGGIVETIINHAVTINSTSVIVSLSFKSVCANKESSSNFGGEGGKKTQILIDWPKEYLTSISGTTAKYNNDVSLVESLTFYTNWRTHGPFGTEKGTHFSLPVENRVIVGFHGRSGLYVDAIGVYQKTAASIQEQFMTPKVNNDKITNSSVSQS